MAQSATAAVVASELEATGGGRRPSRAASPSISYSSPPGNAPPSCSLSWLSATWRALLGPEEYGFVEFTLAVMVFFILPVDLGLGSYGAREIARNPERASRLLHEITGLRLVLAICSIVALLGFILLIQCKPLN